MLRRENVWCYHAEMREQGMAFAGEYLLSEDRGNPESYRSPCNELGRCCRCSRVTGTARLVSFNQEQVCNERWNVPI